MHKRRIALVAGVAAVLVAGAGGAAWAGGAWDDDASDTAITGDARGKAEDAALAETGGGSVTETEVGDEQSKYEVEVTMDDGSQVDVQLDEKFDVVGTENEEGDGDNQGVGDERE